MFVVVTVAVVVVVVAAAVVDGVATDEINALGNRIPLNTQINIGIQVVRGSTQGWVIRSSQAHMNTFPELQRKNLMKFPSPASCWKKI